MSGPVPVNRRDSAALHPLGMPTPVAVRTDSSGCPRALQAASSGKAHGTGTKRRPERGRDRRRRDRRHGPERARAGGPETPPVRQVVQIREVWRIDDEWWRRPISRLYHQVVLDDGGMVVLYRDLIDGRWYLQ